MKHAAGIVASIAIVTLCAVLAFLPGRYDNLAATLSLMAQVFAVVGLLLVPLGAIWIVAEYRRRSPLKRYLFSIAALVALSFVWIFLSLAAALESLTLGITAIALGIVAVIVVVRQLKPGAAPGARTALPLYLLIVPPAALAIQFAIGDRVAGFARSHAIRNSAPLIREIEDYRVRNGRYPASLVALHLDVLPGVMGIREYRYEPAGDAYNLLFEQPTFIFGTQEIVMYNPRGEQAMTSHAFDRLQLAPEQLRLDQMRGHYAEHNAAERNWKYYWFD